MVRHEIKRFSVGAAFRIGAVLNVLLSTVFVGLFTVFQFIVLSAIGDISGRGSLYNNEALQLSGFSFVSLCFLWLISIVFAAIFGGITGALTAFFYNLAAGWVGGLEVTLVAYDSQPDPLAGQWNMTDRAGL